VFVSPLQLLDRVSLPTGSRVGDFGSGAGHYALEVARRLGSESTVYALDPYAPLMDRVRREAQNTGATFFSLESDLNTHIPLKTNLLNVAIVANTLFYITNREKFVSELARVVEPRGQILVVDWMGSFHNMGPVPDSVVTPSEASDLFKRFGFEVGEMMPAGTHHFAFIATCTTQ
jgi:ubiquinone/menaquinone biosynthesis C-methylase UbiE